MSEAYVVCNQLNQFWGKKKRWADGSKPRDIVTFKHEDEALNQLVELSARDVELRGRVEPVTLDDKGVPGVAVSEHRIVDEEDLLAEEAGLPGDEDACETAASSAEDVPAHGE
ncbi:MAG: heat-shock protein HtpX [Halieaceae bacterium]|jgi:hypothetical protein|nr:heat-shock protein HtpX [Halieaceae bacterium]